MPKADNELLTPRTQVRRFPTRGAYDKPSVYAILDRSPMAHISFDNNGSPALLPMVFWRVDDHIYFHGAVKNRMFAALDQQAPVCFVATILDGFVAARDALHHSVNYRCVVIYGTVEKLTKDEEKLQGLKNLMARFYPDRWQNIVPPSQSEFDRVTMYRLPIKEASVKVSAEPSPWPGFPGQKVWSGIIPVELRMGEPIPAPDFDPSDVVPQDFSNIEFVTGPKIAAVTVAAKAEAGAAVPASEQSKSSLAGAFRAEPVGGTVETRFELTDGSTRIVDAPIGHSLMDAAKAADITGVVGECCGSMTCATCHVVVADEWYEKMPASEYEAEMLEYVAGGAERGSRLSCQILIDESMSGLTVTVPEAQR